MVKNQLGKDCLHSRVTIVREKLFKANILLKIIIIVVLFLYASLGESSVVLANNTGPAVTSNLESDRDSLDRQTSNAKLNNNDIEKEDVINEKGELRKSKEPITISVRNASLKETVLGICRSYHISVMGVESLTGNITATVQGEAPEDLIKELGRLYHFSVSKQYNTILIEPDDKGLENRELYVITPEHLPAESLKNIMGTVVKQDKMAVLSEQNEVITHLTS